MLGNINGRRVRKVRQACDRCKAKKLRCSGTRPCDVCTARRQHCRYTSEDGRSRGIRGSLHRPSPSQAIPDSLAPTSAQDVEHALDSASSPETAVVDGQHQDATSGMSFLRRAQARFSYSKQHSQDYGDSSLAEDAPLMTAGDKRLLGGDTELSLPPHDEAVVLLDLYFDVCVATYRILHRPSVDDWLRVMETSEQKGLPISTGLGNAKPAIVLGLLAIATFHTQKAKGFSDDENSLLLSDTFFRAAVHLTAEETGLPKVESIQARLTQVFYLLMTCRMNRAWYVFGDVLQLISALGIHRLGRRAASSGRAGVDYIVSQCRRRIFWTAYILDKYLGVVLGRPPRFHDEDINLDFPARVNDEDMTSSGPNLDVRNNVANDCQIDAFVCNAKLAQIVGTISRSLYPIRPITEEDRLNRLRQVNRQLDQWKSKLPAFLGSVRPSTLIRSFRRQSIALKVAYSHAVMHANRTSLLTVNAPSFGDFDVRMDEENITRCLVAAEEVLRIVDGMAKEGPLFHAFWWTHYVTFCALSVVLIWELQAEKLGHEHILDHRHSLFELAERCQHHLANATATNSPSRKYTIILDELRAEKQTFRTMRLQQSTTQRSGHTQQSYMQEDATLLTGITRMQPPDAQQDSMPLVDQTTAQDWFRDWNAIDWMDLDALAFGQLSDLSPQNLDWLNTVQ